MKQLLILSGKGGTGKTTVASALIRLFRAEAYADCDVDAPNLHLITARGAAPQRTDFWGMDKAAIDPARCTACGRCRESCRFEAIGPGQTYTVDPFACEGCGVCAAVCPAGAITLEPAVAGELQLFTWSGAVFSTAQLKMGSGNSGKLVTEVKKQLQARAAAAELAIIDGSPGIGCPVIASLSGVDMVLIVAEPSVSGISDLERIIQTAAKFGVRSAICINRFDTNAANTGRIEAFCAREGLPCLGRIPFDPLVVTAINAGQTIVDIDCQAGEAVKGIYRQVRELLLGGPG